LRVLVVILSQTTAKLEDSLLLLQTVQRGHMVVDLALDLGNLIGERRHLDVRARR
jgi:hypothetical protein